MVSRNLTFNTDNPNIRTLVHANGGKQMVAALEFLKASEFEDQEQNGAAEQAAAR